MRHVIVHLHLLFDFPCLLHTTGRVPVVYATSYEYLYFVEKIAYTAQYNTGTDSALLHQRTKATTNITLCDDLSCSCINHSKTITLFYSLTHTLLRGDIKNCTAYI